MGKNPFFGRNLRETMLNTLQIEVEPLVESVPGIPPELAELVEKLLAKEPSERPADGAAAAGSLGDDAPTVPGLD